MKEIIKKQFNEVFFYIKNKYQNNHNAIVEIKWSCGDDIYTDITQYEENSHSWGIYVDSIGEFYKRYKKWIDMVPDYQKLCTATILGEDEL